MEVPGTPPPGVSGQVRITPLAQAFETAKMWTLLEVIPDKNSSWFLGMYAHVHAQNTIDFP